ncbi:MAG: SDR family oxidoreductase [Actinobacteria bacterium]|nr:SDR family oxidoreductase [Actinomycetota bacterium]
MSPQGPFTRPLAVVTGASSGIGRVFAHRLADREHDLVLVARNDEALQRLADEIADHARVHIDVISADLATTEGVALVAGQLSGAAVLVNSAGYGSVGSVIELPEAEQVGQIRLNIEALTVLSRAAAAGMTERGRGAIINIGSTAGFQPIPYEATYAATKAYVASFSQALAEEVGGAGVRVLCVCPGYTATGFADRAGAEFSQLPSVMVSTPEHVVDTALRDLDRGRSMSIPGYLNAALAVGSKVSPTWLTRKVSGVLTKRTL